MHDRSNNCKGIESLTDQFVPKKYHHLHKQLITLRDKTTAHVDARNVFFQDSPANNVVLIVREHGNRLKLAVQQAKLKPSAIKQIRERASGLVDRMLKYITEVADKFPNNVPDDGEYLIDLATRTLRRL